MNEIAKHCWGEDQNFNCDQKKVANRKAGQFLEKSKKPSFFK